MGSPTLYLNARVLTLDPANRVDEGVAVEDGRILATGTVRELRERASGAREVDLAGHVLIPGFVDAHSHLAMVGEHALHRVDLNSPPIGDVTCIDDLVTRLGERAHVLPDDAWLVGIGYDDTLLAEKRHPTRFDLDRVSRERPILVRHISGHLGVANSAALRAAKLNRLTQDPMGGVIRRDAAGEPDGVLEETALFSLRVPARTHAQRLEAIEHAARLYAARGITTAQNGFTDSLEVKDFDDAFCAGRVPLRVVLWPGFGAMRRLIDGRLELQTPPERLAIGAVKLFADGSIQGYTGHLCQPYHVPFKGQHGYRGYAAMPDEELQRLVGEIHAAGYQVAVHVNGDAAIDAFLNAFAKAQSEHPREDARPIAVHAQMTREDQIDAMRDLGVVPSFFCLHTFYWGDRHRDVFLGEDRARRISPGRSAADRGLRFTIHTDAPVVPMDPMLLMWSAVNRKTTGGEVLGPEQRLTPLEALRATTIDAAWQHRLEHDRGSIEPGKLADFAVLDGDPLTDPEATREIRVVDTIVGGRSVRDG